MLYVDFENQCYMEKDFLAVNLYCSYDKNSATTINIWKKILYDFARNTLTIVERGGVGQGHSCYYFCFLKALIMCIGKYVCRTVDNSLSSLPNINYLIIAKL